MSSSAIKRYSLSKQVSDKIVKLIENQTYKLNERIPTEVELIEMFHVSRNTIREAIQSLVSIGILEVKQGDGTYVRANNRLDATMLMMFKNVKLNDINEARKTLEVSLSYYAAVRRSDEDLERIANALKDRRDCKGDEREYTLYDIKFHMEIANASHNELLVSLYKSLYTFIVQNIQSRKNQTNMSTEDINEYHEQLYNAIKEQDGKNAQVYARKILNI